MESPPYRAPLESALANALAHLDGIDAAQVAATLTLAELRAPLGRSLDETGVEAAQVIQEPVAGYAGCVLGSVGGHFFGWVIGGATPAPPAIGEQRCRRSRRGGRGRRVT